MTRNQTTPLACVGSLMLALMAACSSDKVTTSTTCPNNDKADASNSSTSDSESGSNDSNENTTVSHPVDGGGDGTSGITDAGSEATRAGAVSTGLTDTSASAVAGDAGSPVKLPVIGSAPIKVVASTSSPFCFELPENADFTYSVQDPSSRVIVEVHLSSILEDPPTPISKLDTTTTAVTPVALEKGEYCIVVTSPDGVSGEFALSMSVAMYVPTESTNEPGSSPDDAPTLLNVTTTLQSFGGYVGPTDEDDYYCFDLAENANATLSLKDLTTRTFGFLYNVPQDGELNPDAPVLEMDTSEDKVYPPLPLEKGHYCLHVWSFYDGISRPDLYTLSIQSVDYDPAEPESEPGGDPAHALEYSPVAAELQTFGGYVGPTDEDDFYCFDLGENTNATLSLKNLTTRTFGYLYNIPQGGELNPAAPVLEMDTSEDKVYPPLPLEKGHYCLHVWSFYDGISRPDLYTLSLQFIDYELAEPSIEPGIDPAHALDITPVTDQSQSFGGYVGPTDEDDYYCFDLSEDISAVLSLKNLTTRTFGYLYNIPQGGELNPAAPVLEMDTSEDKVYPPLPLEEGHYCLHVWSFYDGISRPDLYTFTIYRE